MISAEQVWRHDGNPGLTLLGKTCKGSCFCSLCPTMFFFVFFCLQVIQVAIRLCYCCAAVGPFCQRFPWRSVHSLHTTCGKSYGTWVRDDTGDISPNTHQNTSRWFADHHHVLEVILILDFVFCFFPPLQGHSMMLATTMLC